MISATPEPPDLITCDIPSRDSRDVINSMNTIIRKIKINSFNGSDLDLDRIYLDNYSPNDIKILKEVSKIGVICGSTALKLYGYIGRSTNDIDLIVTQEVFDNLKDKYTINNHSSIYGDGDDLGSAGYIIYDKYEVDLFIKDEPGSYNTMEGVRVSNLLENVIYKLNLYKKEDRFKDNEDILDIERCFNTGKKYMMRSTITPIKRNIFIRLFYKYFTKTPEDLSKYS